MAAGDEAVRRLRNSVGLHTVRTTHAFSKVLHVHYQIMHHHHSVSLHTVRSTFAFSVVVHVCATTQITHASSSSSFSVGLHTVCVCICVLV